jgi:MFS superfamily sulfate permease-like transporter
MFKNQQLRQNFTSGLLVSFIALPLCIAISLASSFPILSGIFTAIIGGILVSQISGARLAINGPAAGMIVVILEAVEKLGAGDVALGYKYTLAAILCAALIQLATSFTSLPNLLRKFPESIIRGMMVAIGLIVILKQLFVLFGFKAPKVPLLQLFAEVPNAFLGANLITLGIGTFTIVTIFVWKKYLEKYQIFRLIPVYLFVIICGAGLAYVAHLTTSHFFLRESMANPATSLFIEIPHSIFSAFSLPDFSQFFSLKFFIATFTIYAVGSLETILSSIAVDKIDPQKNHTDLKKDLRAIGIGNAICGAIGGLPMITEIVRSSANIKYGATNKWSNFFHGVCLLVAVTIFNPLLHFIPLCVLAAMLVIIGINLINFPLLKKIFNYSKIDFVSALTVVFCTLKIDLLIVIGSGLIVYFLLRKFQKILAK